MPIYEYKCPQCNNIFEEWVKSHAHTAICPQCQATAEQIISNTAFVLKGGGWYVTEYGNRKGESNKEREQAANQDKSSDQGSGQDKSSAQKSSVSNAAKVDSAKGSDAKSDTTATKVAPDQNKTKATAKDAAI